MASGEADLAAYTRSIERLNTSLGFLQTEMQRLAQQQEKIMAMREQQQQQQAWVIPPPAPSPHRYLFELYVKSDIEYPTKKLSHMKKLGPPKLIITTTLILRYLKLSLKPIKTWFTPEMEL